MTTQVLTISSSEEKQVLAFINTNFANGTVQHIEGTTSLYKIRGILPLEQKNFDANTRYQLVMPTSNIYIIYIPAFKLINTVRPYTDEEVKAFKASKQAE
jgi:hypothetical protein